MIRHECIVQSSFHAFQYSVVAVVIVVVGAAIFFGSFSRLFPLLYIFDFDSNVYDSTSSLSCTPTFSNYIFLYIRIRSYSIHMNENTIVPYDYTAAAADIICICCLRLLLLHH